MDTLLSSSIRRTAAALCQALKRRMYLWTRPKDHSPLRNVAADLTRSRSELILDNALLRHRLIVLQRQAKRPTLTWSDRALFVLLASTLRSWKQALLIVQPDTVLAALLVRRLVLSKTRLLRASSPNSRS